MRTQERSRGRLGASRGASEPSRTRPEHGGLRPFDQVWLPGSRRWQPLLLVLDDFGLAFYACEAHRAAGVVFALAPLPLLHAISRPGLGQIDWRGDVRSLQLWLGGARAPAWLVLDSAVRCQLV